MPALASGGGMRGAVSVAVLVATGVLASVGCVTIDDRPTEEAGASGQGQGGGNGGGSAKGGSSQGGSAGAGKAGGGSGGSAGTSSNVKCGDLVEPSATRVRACVYSMSCNPLRPQFTMSDCVTYGYYSNCEASAKSCEDVGDCTGTRREPLSACTPDSPAWRCEGNSAIRCGSGDPFSVDCERVSDTCDLFESEQDSGRLPCKLNSPSSCATDDPGSTACSGSAAYACIEGKAYGLDCSTFGYVCMEPTPGLAYCTDRYVPCDDEQAGVVSCEGNSIQVCDESHRFASYDCTPAGSVCHVEGTSDGSCLAPGCTPESVCDEECLDETRMQLCVGNAPYELDCTDYGFERCVTYVNHPVTGGDYVECRTEPLP